MEKKYKPLNSKAPGLRRFATEHDLMIFLYDQYWGEREQRTLEEIAAELGITGARVREYLLKFHITLRGPGQRARKDWR